MFLIHYFLHWSNFTLGYRCRIITTDYKFLFNYDSTVNVSFDIKKVLTRKSVVATRKVYSRAAKYTYIFSPYFLAATYEFTAVGSIIAVFVCLCVLAAAKTPQE